MFYEHLTLHEFMINDIVVENYKLEMFSGKLDKYLLRFLHGTEDSARKTNSKWNAWG